MIDRLLGRLGKDDQPKDEKDTPESSDTLVSDTFAVSEKTENYIWLEYVEQNWRGIVPVKTSSDEYDETVDSHVSSFEEGDTVQVSLVRSADEWLFTEKPANAEETNTASVLSGTVPSAYDFSHDRTFKFNEEVVFSEINDDFVSVTVETVANSVTFDVRVNGYTGRFVKDTIDAEYMSIGSYAVNVYYPIPDDEYLVRRLFYYEDKDGIGSEKQYTVSGKTNTYDWNREEHGSTRHSIQQQKTRITIYDWREKMPTHNKPTPNDNEVVLRYSDSTTQGGNRSEVDNRIRSRNIQLVSGDAATAVFIRVNKEERCFEMYAVGESAYRISLPIGREVTPSSVVWETIDSCPSPFDVSNVIWVENKCDTWATSGYSRDSYVSSENNDT